MKGNKNKFFSIADVPEASDPSHPFGTMAFQSHLAQIGISVEPITQLAQQTPDTFANTSNVEPFIEFSRKMVENFFNYCASFSITQAQMTPNPSETYVPISPLQNWFTNFQRRFEQNPYFWRSWHVHYKTLYHSGFIHIFVTIVQRIIKCDWVIKHVAELVIIISALFWTRLLDWKMNGL